MPCRTVPVQLRRRHAASYRCQPLGESSNIRDPWVSWRPEKLSEKEIDGAAAAAAHLLAHGYAPIFEKRDATGDAESRSPPTRQ